MKNYRSLGEQHRLQHGYPFDEHELFHEYLLISPSYFIAHQFKTAQLTDHDAVHQIPQWDSVLKTYELCGDVYATPFLNWWDTLGRNLFYTQLSDGTFAKQGALCLQTSKINEITLIEGVSLINEKARLQKKNGKRIENWKLGVEVGIRSKWTQQLNNAKKKTFDNEEARTAMGVLVSRKLKQAFYIAENAARGLFPVDSHINTGLEFNYSQQFNLTTAVLIAENKLKRERQENGQYTPKSYFARKVAPKQNREKKIQQEIERQLKMRLKDS